MNESWPWVALFLLGAYHGVNPGMGWLFAVALGLQEKSRKAVLRALPPIALGHALAIGMVVASVGLLQSGLSGRTLRLGAAAVLFAFGLYRLFRSRHPRWVGMQVGFRDLTLWSFAMATAHGAGLMLLPVMLRWPAAGHDHGARPQVVESAQMLSLAGPGAWLGPVGVHTLGYLVVAMLVAFVVYEKLGVGILRQAWFNLDRVWGIALVVTGILTLFV